MRLRWAMTAGLIALAAAGLAAVLALSFARTSGDGAAPRYEVTVAFTEAATQADIEETAALLRAYDADADFLVMEIFPPIGRALVSSDSAEFCPTVTAELEAKAYVDRASCRLWVQPAGSDPDSPVSGDGGE